MCLEHPIPTVLWMIGEIVAEFYNKRMFILYRPDGVGKSSVINIVTFALGGNSPSISASDIKFHCESTRQLYPLLLKKLSLSFVLCLCF